MLYVAVNKMRDKMTYLHFYRYKNYIHIYRQKHNNNS